MITSQAFAIDISITQFVILQCVAFFAGFLSAIAGGGGLIILPALLAVGLPPLNALATTKLQGLFGIATSSRDYAKKGFIDFSRLRSGLIYSGLFSALGVYWVQQIETHVLEQTIPLLLIAVSVYMLLQSTTVEEDRKPRISDVWFNRWVGSSTGFYIGIFGPGIGSFLIVAFRALRGDGVTSAVANSKPYILAANLVATGAFMLAGHTWWVLGLTMAVAQVVGAKLGTKMAIKQGAKLIRPLFLLVTTVLAIKLLISGY